MDFPPRRYTDVELNLTFFCCCCSQNFAIFFKKLSFKFILHLRATKTFKTKCLNVLICSTQVDDT